MFGLKNLSSSIKGVFIGFIFVVISFLLVYLNEGRIDYSEMAVKAKAINIGNQADNQSLNNQFVSATGIISAPEKIGDDFFLKPDNYIFLQRKTEVYAWTEDKHERGNYNSTKNLNVEDQKYEYQAKWVTQAPNSSKFRFPEDHNNINKIYDDFEKKAELINIGDYIVYLNNLDIPAPSPLSLSEDKMISNNKVKLGSDKYFFSGQGTLADPVIGDQRISYLVIPNNVLATIFGKLVDNRITTYSDSHQHQLFRMILGDRENAINKMHNEYIGGLWAMRIFGFILMWLGFSLILGPFCAVMSLVPFFGKLLKTASQTVIRIVTFVIALILSVVCIIFSIILHNIVALLIISLIIGVIIVVFFNLKNRNKPAV